MKSGTSTENTEDAHDYGFVPEEPGTP